MDIFLYKYIFKTKASFPKDWGFTSLTFGCLSVLFFFCLTAQSPRGVQDSRPNDDHCDICCWKIQFK